jgi:ATP-dependent exoDNAse (exonuclease V) alpha subunit
VVRQRDPAERAALAALHDGDPERYLDHKAEAITLHATDHDALEAATERWAELRAEHGPTAVGMIARDNSTREQLNTTARARLLADGLLADDGARIGDRDWAVGDRVIARRNDRRIGIDNGTTATITALAADGGRVVVRTDAGQRRVLDRAYVTDHLEHAYAITGHSSQGATVEAAIIVGRPEEFTREWAYTVASRARRDNAAPDRRPRARRYGASRLLASATQARAGGHARRARGRDATQRRRASRDRARPSRSRHRLDGQYS